jgi:predicted DNA-binding WGR domain protein
MICATICVSVACMIFFRIDPANNIRRFWLAHVTPTLLGGWSLVREWGRIGQPGTVKASSFDSEAEARRAEQRGIRRRALHGYQPFLDVVSRWPTLLAAGGSIRAPEKRSQIKSKPGNYSASVKQGRFDF